MSLIVYLVRHGETDQNRQGIIQGQLETSLNETGREQTRRLAVALKDIHFDHYFTSSIGRAIEVFTYGCLYVHVLMEPVDL